MRYLGNQITTVFSTSISVDSATITGNTTIGGTLGVTGVSTLSDNIVFDASSKGVHLGVTSATASNLLDDYEEGTWTPTLENYGGTPTIANAVYTKIGRQVTIAVQVTLDGTSDSSNFRILGLPFTSFTGNGAGVFGAFRSYSNGTIGFSLIGSNQAQINNYDSSGSNQTYNGAGNNKDFRFVGIYFTA